MAFQQLGAVGRHQEQVIGIENRRVIVYETNKFIQNGSRWCYNTPRNYETINVKSIAFDTDLELQELWNRIEYLQLQIGPQKILLLEKPFLETITTIERIGNKWNFIIDFSPFIPDIPIIALCLHEFKYDLILNNSTGISNIECITENVYLEAGPRRELARNGHKLPIQQLQGHIIQFEERLEVCIRLNFINILKGYFIYGDINNIQNVTLKYNNEIRYSYDRMMLRMISKKINDTLLYIPYNHSVDWKNTSFNSYVDGCNHSIIDFVTMKVEYLTPQTKIGLYGISSNIIFIKFGMGDLALEYPNGSIHLLEPVTPCVWSNARKPVPDGRNFCPIAYDEIKDGENYCECAGCHNCFSEVQLKTAFQIMPKKCPICREIWTNWVVYTNSGEH